MKKTQWIIIATRIGASIYHRDSKLEGNTLLFSLDHPEGRLKSQDINTSPPGRAVNTTGRPFSSPYVGRQSAKEHELENFCKNLVALLEKGRTDSSFEEIVMIAESHMIGAIRKEMSDLLLNRVAKTIHQNLAKVPQYEVEKFINQNA